MSGSLDSEPIYPARPDDATYPALGAMLLLAAAAAALLAGGARAQSPEEVVREIRFEQRLNQQLPLETHFRDESGRAVRLGEYFGRRPVILALVYYQCPMLCNTMLNGLARCLKTISLNPGGDYEICIVSIDPKEKPELAAQKKLAYTGEYDRPGTEQGWHFLTGDQSAIDALTASAGFHYVYDSNSGQFAHGSGIVVATPEGRLARYFFGIEFAPRDVRLGLVEASSGKIGNIVDQVLLYCYEYNPIQGKYGFAIFAVLRGFGLLLIGSMALFAFWHIRRERRTAARAAPSAAPPNTPAAPDGEVRA